MALTCAEFNFKLIFNLHIILCSMNMTTNFSFSSLDSFGFVVVVFIYLKMSMRELSIYFILNNMFCSYAESFSFGSYCFEIVIENDSSQRLFCFAWNETKWHRVTTMKWSAVNKLFNSSTLYCAPDECVKWSENRWDYSNRECD